MRVRFWIIVILILVVSFCGKGGSEYSDFYFAIKDRLPVIEKGANRITKLLEKSLDDRSKEDLKYFLETHEYLDSYIDEFIELSDMKGKFSELSNDLLELHRLSAKMGRDQYQIFIDYFDIGYRHLKSGKKEIYEIYLETKQEFHNPLYKTLETKMEEFVNTLRKIKTDRGIK